VLKAENVSEREREQTKARESANARERVHTEVGQRERQRES
jgi:hypothetical protein